MGISETEARGREVATNHKVTRKLRPKGGERAVGVISG